jgi:hypothetical protein
MRKLAEMKKTVEKWRGLEKQISDIIELITLAEEEKDSSLVDGYLELIN